MTKEVPETSNSAPGGGAGSNLSSAPQPYLSSRKRGTRRRAVIAITIVLILAAAGLGSYVALYLRSGSSTDVVGDGPTLYQALRGVNSSVNALSGGPWVLSQVYGIASPIPTNPTAWGWGEYDQTFASCHAAFNGLTIWNGTIPLFHGTFNSGTAPFWQFVYFSNASQQLLVANDVLGVVHVLPPVALSSECAVRSGLGFEPWRSAFFWSRVGFPGDTPTMASDAWTVMAQRYVAWLGEPVGEMYLFGGSQFGSRQAAATQVQCFICGTAGAAGITPVLAIYGSTDEPWYTGNSDNYTLGCTPTTNYWTAIPLELKFSNATTATGLDATVVSETFQFLDAGTPPYSGPGYNTRGVTSWMIDLNLTDSSGHQLPITRSGCSTWVPSLSDCIANSSGWYAVLLAPGGGWLGSFGGSSTAPGWSYPVVPIVNNETLAIVLPPSSSTSGDVLTVSSTTNQLPLNGSMVLP